MRLAARCTFSLLVLGALAGCATGLSPSAPRIELYRGHPMAGFHVAAVDPDTEQLLAASSVTVAKAAESKFPNSLVSVTKSAKEAPDDALTLRWKDIWKSAVRIQGTPIDLSAYMAKGTMAFDLNVAELSKGGIVFKVGCGKGCERQVPYVVPGRAAQGQGWRHIVLAMRCFARDGDHFTAVNQPFAVEGTGTGEVSVANVVVDSAGTPNTACHDYRSAAVTPAPLEESWSLDWWMPRHQQKLDELKAFKAAGKQPELVFIGDSIIHSWEKAGASIWEREYKRYNAYNLGFAGDRTENVLWRLQHGEVDGIRPKVAVLMFGTNNTGARQDAPAVTAAAIGRNIDELRRRLPTTRILLLAIFPRDATPAGLLRPMNEEVNAILRTYADNRQVFFLNINQAFLKPDGTLATDIMPDLLHPNDKGYEIWAKAMRPELDRLLNLSTPLP